MSSCRHQLSFLQKMYRVGNSLFLVLCQGPSFVLKFILLCIVKGGRTLFLLLLLLFLLLLRLLDLLLLFFLQSFPPLPLLESFFTAELNTAAYCEGWKDALPPPSLPSSSARSSPPPPPPPPSLLSSVFSSSSSVRVLFRAEFDTAVNCEGCKDVRYTSHHGTRFPADLKTAKKLSLQQPVTNCKTEATAVYRCHRNRLIVPASRFNCTRFTAKRVLL